MLTLTLVYKLQSTHLKQNQKGIMHESNKSCMLQTGRKPIRSIKNRDNSERFLF